MTNKVRLKMAKIRWKQQVRYYSSERSFSCLFANGSYLTEAKPQCQKILSFLIFISRLAFDIWTLNFHYRYYIGNG